MKPRDLEKYGLAGIMFSGFFAGLFTENNASETSVLFFSLSMISFGVLLTMVIVDWWQGRRSNDQPNQPENEVPPQPGDTPTQPEDRR